MSTVAAPLVKKKTALIESLMSITADLLKEIDSGDVDQSEKALRDRDRLLQDLQNVDVAIGQNQTNQDQVWILQLQKLQAMDKDLKDRMAFQMEIIKKSLAYSKQQKESFIRQESLDPRGNQFHGKA